MTEESKENKRELLLQWHAAFYADIRIELEDEAQYLEFENEHMLSSKPMQLDVLIIKKEKERQIQKNIGRIFRTYNIVEYKSPEDYLSVDDFFKVYGYTCFYKSDTGKVDEIKAEEITITFVCNRYPEKLISYLEKDKHRFIRKVESGIYYVSDALFQIQIIVQKQLSEAENLWLKSLTNDLKDRTEAEKLLRVYKKHERDNLYQAVMDVIVRANEERFKVADMCEALEEIMREKMKDKIAELERQAEERGLSIGMERGMEQGMARGMAQGMEQGMAQGVISLVEKKLAKGKSLAQIADELEETEDAIRPIYEEVQAKMAVELM